MPKLNWVAILIGMTAGLLCELVSRKFGLTTTVGGDLLACAMVTSLVQRGMSNA